MVREIDNFFLKQDEPVKGALICLRKLILDYDKNITEAWKYRMPFYCYKGKMLCYLWISKKNDNPYIGIVEGKKIIHPLLQMEKRSRMKTMQLDAHQDLQVETIQKILKMAIDLY